MFSALAAVCTVYCDIEIVLITLHYITISKSYRTAPYSATHSKDGDFLTVGPVTVATAVLSLDFSARILYE